MIYITVWKEKKHNDFFCWFLQLHDNFKEHKTLNYQDDGWVIAGGRIWVLQKRTLKETIENLHDRGLSDADNFSIYFKNDHTENSYQHLVDKWKSIQPQIDDRTIIFLDQCTKEDFADLYTRIMDNRSDSNNGIYNIYPIDSNKILIDKDEKEYNKLLTIIGSKPLYDWKQIIDYNLKI